MVTYGSVCSGIEAASVAWGPLGWRCAFMSEIDKFPRAVLTHRFPGVPLRGDFTEIQEGEHESIDMLVGGTPCQSFSVAGLRGGMDDERGNLALEYCRLAARLGPRWVVWENVPGVLSSNGGRDFGAFLGALVELGYGVAYRVLDAQYFGVPQRRRRVFVVGYLGDWRRAAAVLFEPEGMSGGPATRREAGEGATADVSGGLRGPLVVDARQITHPENRSIPRDVCPTLARSSRPVVFGDRLPRLLTPRERERLLGFPDDWTRIDDTTRDSPRNRGLGDSAAVPVLGWLGRRIGVVEATVNKNA